MVSFCWIEEGTKAGTAKGRRGRMWGKIEKKNLAQAQVEWILAGGRKKEKRKGGICGILVRE